MIKKPSKARIFRELVESPSIVQVPSAYDALSARVIQQAGFQAIHMTGSGSSASILGLPDLGFTSISEMAEHAKNIALSVDVPAIVDADTTFGNALNTYRTIREYERAGMVGVHMEDQITPKRCGHLEGKKLISTKEMMGKIEAAVDAREDSDFMIIARTDAREEFGLNSAIERAKAYVDAGADCIFVEAPYSREEMIEVRRSLSVPLLANMVEGGKTPWFTAAELNDMGYNLVIYPLSGWMAATTILKALMQELKDKGTTQQFWSRMGLQMSFHELFEVFGYAHISDLEEKFVRVGEMEDA